MHRHPRIFEEALDLAAGLGIPLRALTPEMARRIRERHCLPWIRRWGM
ncbi:MAG: hypothetical protein ACHQ7N_16830 [Candidatus Methylomirabilales bacterium]